MPYRDKEKTAEAMRRSRQKRKGITETPVIPVESVILDSVSGPKDVIPVIPPDLPPEWQNVIDFISRPTRKGDISNLEKLQRIAGSLGKLGSHVWMGSLNLEEIGKGIGVKQPPALTEKRGL